MAGVFADSFAHYSISQILRKWTYAQSFSASLVSGRDGRTGLNIVSGLLAITIPHQSTYISGVAMLYTNAPGGTIMEHCHVDQTVVQLKLLSDGTLATYVVDLGGFMGSSIKSLHAGIFYYIEMSSTISGGKGAPITAHTIVKVDGETYLDVTLSYSNINFLTLQQATLNGVKLGQAAGGAGGTTTYNDFYIVNTIGINNTFLGDVIIGAIYAIGDNTNEFSPGLPHFSRINEHIADDDSSTVYSDTVGQYELYTWDTIATFEGTIPFVHYLICARKDKEGLRSIVPIVGGASIEVGGEQFLNQNYLYYKVAMDTDPANGGWTVDVFNNEKFGFKIKT